MKAFILSLFLLSSVASAQIKIAVVDTGLNLSDKRFTPYLCQDGHKDFTGEGLLDFHGHGTHIVGSIIKYAGETGYCLIIIKAFSIRQNNEIYLNAIGELMNIQPNFVNISGGGQSAFKREKLVLKKLKDTKFIVAAGNDNKDLGKFKYYPASYNLPNIIIVGSVDENGVKSPKSNYGAIVKAWEIGDDVLSTCMHDTECKMSGTSMSTSIHTGKLIKKYVETH